MTKLEQAARQVVANGVQGTYAKYYSVPPADFEALREALAEQAEQEPIRFVWNGEGWIEADDYIWKTTPDAERRELYAAPQPAQEPVARVTGYHGGRCVVEPLNRALVLPTDMALYAEPMQQVTRADLKAAFKEGFERAADLYAPNDGQEPYAYEVWDVQDQSFTMIYATQLKEFHWIEPENIARVLYTAPMKQAEQRIPSHVHIIKQMEIITEHEPVAKVDDTAPGFINWTTWKLPEQGTPLYAARVRTKDLTGDELSDLVFEYEPCENPFEFARAVIAADRKLNDAK